MNLTSDRDGLRSNPERLPRCGARSSLFFTRVDNETGRDYPSEPATGTASVP